MARKKGPLKNLAASAKAIKKSVKQISKAATKAKKSRSKKTEPQPKQRNKRSYSFRQLPLPKGKTLNEYLVNLELHADDVDKLLHPGEFFTVKFFGSTTYSSFDSASLISNYLSRYSFVTYYGDLEDYLPELIEDIRIVKFGSGPRVGETEEETERRNLDTYQRQRRKQVAQRQAENLEVERAAETLFKRPAEKGKKMKPTRIQLLKDAIATFEDYSKKLQDAQARIDALEKKLAAKSKPAKKKTAKKAAKKKTVTKSKGKGVSTSGKKSTKKAATKKAVSKSKPTTKVSKKQASSKINQKKTGKAKKGMK